MAQWNAGDVITAEKLNQSSVLTVYINQNEEDGPYVCDKTWQEISNSTYAVAKLSKDNGIRNCYLIDVFSEDDIKGVVFLSPDFGNGMFKCENPDGYPYINSLQPK